MKKSDDWRADGINALNEYSALTMESYGKPEAGPAPQSTPPPHNRMAIANLVHPPPTPRLVPMSGRIQPPPALNQPVTHHPGSAPSRHNLPSSLPMRIPPPTPPHATPASQSDADAGNISPSVVFDTYPYGLISHSLSRQNCDNCGMMYASDSADVYHCRVRSALTAVLDLY